MKLVGKITSMKNWQIFIVFLILGLIAYINVINGDFLWDETSLITGNEYTQSFKHFTKWFTESTISGSGLEGNLYRPFATFVYASTYALFGLNEAAFHGVNILVHITNSFLVFILLQRLNFIRFGSLMAAIIFLLHPVQTESVSYIAGLPDVLSPLFILIGLILFIGKSETEISTKQNIILVTLLILGVLSKETGIVFVPLIALILFFKKQDFSKQEISSRMKTIIILSIVTLIYISLRFTVLKFGDSLSLVVGESSYTQNILVRIYTFFEAIVEYAILTFYPKHLYFEKEFVIATHITLKAAIGMVITATASMLAILSYRKKRHFLFTYIWFAITISLISGIIIPANSTYKEHWLYMPLIGIVVLIPSFWESLKSKASKQILLVIFFIIIILAITKIISRNNEWKDYITFFETEISYNNSSPRIYERIGIYYFAEEEYKEAMKYFKIGVDNDQDNLMPQLRTNLGNTYLAMKNLNAAVNEYFTVLERHPNHIKAHEALRNIATATNNKPMEKTFMDFIKRIENGGSVDFNKEILKFAS